MARPDPRAARAAPAQSTDAVLMVRPAVFYANAETAASNAFQAEHAAVPSAEVLTRARAEFDAVVVALTDAGVRVCAVDALPAEDTPDALFPNNWISTAPDGTVTLYPMHAPNRRRERRDDIVRALSERFAYAVRRVIDLSELETFGAI